MTVTSTKYVQNIELNTYAIKWPVGRTGSYKPSVSPADATNKNLTWKSSNTSVAAVSSAGLLTAVGPGTATITCTAADGGGAKASCQVTVYQPVTSITLDSSSLNWSVGKQAP